MENKTNKLLLATTICLFFLVLYQAFFIMKIKADKKSTTETATQINAQNKKAQATSNKDKYKNNFKSFEYNSKFGSEFDDWDKSEDLELYNHFGNTLINRFKEELMSSFGIDIHAALDEYYLDETENEYIAQFHIPDMENMAINVEIKNDQLTISGNYEIKEENNNFYNSRSGSFKKSITIPGDIKESAVSSNYKNNILTIVMPKDPNKQNLMLKKIPELI